MVVLVVVVMRHQRKRGTTVKPQNTPRDNDLVVYGAPGLTSSNEGERSFQVNDSSSEWDVVDYAVLNDAKTRAEALGTSSLQHYQQPSSQAVVSGSGSQKFALYEDVLVKQVPFKQISAVSPSTEYGSGADARSFAKSMNQQPVKDRLTFRTFSAHLQFYQQIGPLRVDDIDATESEQ